MNPAVKYFLAKIRTVCRATYMLPGSRFTEARRRWQKNGSSGISGDNYPQMTQMAQIFGFRISLKHVGSHLRQSAKSVDCSRGPTIRPAPKCPDDPEKCRSPMTMAQDRDSTGAAHCAAMRIALRSRRNPMPIRARTRRKTPVNSAVHTG